MKPLFPVSAVKLEAFLLEFHIRDLSLTLTIAFLGGLCKSFFFFVFYFFGF